VSRAGQQGYVLFMVVVMLFVLATIAFLVSYESSFQSNQRVIELEATRADYVAKAALQHALWQNSNNACVGAFSIPATALGADSYTASATGGGSTSLVSLSVDQDGFIKNHDPGQNNGTVSKVHIQFESPKQEHVLYRFDLSSLASGAQINSAVASFYLYNDVGRQHPEGPITIHRVTTDWTELDATWDTINGNFEGTALTTIPAQDIGGVWVQVNLTAQVQMWVNGGANYGILLKSRSEGVHTHYAAKEDATHAPRLDVTIGTSPVSSLTIQATGTLANGVTRTLDRSDVPVYQSHSSVALQPGPALNDTYTNSSGPGINHGPDTSFEVGDAGAVRYALLEFDLGTVPVGARVVSAVLSLNLESVAAAPAGAVIAAHRMLEPWTENGATYNTSDGSTSWDWPENFDSTASVVTVPFESPSPGWIDVDIQPLVAAWLDAAAPYYGFVLAGANGVNNARFTSSDAVDESLHPRLSVTLACDCATACLSPHGYGDILFVVDKDFAMAAHELALQATFESWGYSVTPISDNRSQSEYDTQAALHDVVYVAETASSGQLASKLTDMSIGVVTENGEQNDELGIASGRTTAVGSSVNIVDSSHYISQPFSTGALAIYAANMEVLTVSGTVAPGLQMLVDWGSVGAGALVVLDQAAQGIGGPVAGRRVMLPLGRSTTSGFNWKFLGQNGRLLVQRSIEWAMGPKAPPGATPLLLVVVDDTSLTDQEITKIGLVESWGFDVSIIDEDDTQGEFDTALANAAVVFVTEDVAPGNVNTKLTGAIIGVVTEEVGLTDELGFSDGFSMASGTQLTIDNDYFLTSPLPSGPVTLLTESEPMAYLTGNVAPGIQSPGTSGSGLALVALEAGANSTIGATAGRRVLLPWGGDSMDVNHLNANGLSVFQRALDWAADPGGATTSIYILSTDSPAEIGGLSFTDRDLAAYKPWDDTATLFFDGSLTTLSKEIDALHVLANGHLLLSPKGSTTLGGLSIDDDDLVDYDMATNTSTMIFDGSTLFSDINEKVISVHVLANGHLVMSTDSNATLGGLSFTDRDLVEYDLAADTATLYFDGSATTLSKEITTIQALSNAHIVLSPKKETTVGGVSFEPGDLVDYDPVADSAELIFDGSELFTVPDEKLMSVHIGPGSGMLACIGYFSDEFNAISFSGDDGALNWVADWLEIGESDGANAGEIRVLNDESNYQLRTERDDNGVDREADLSGATSATLTYDFRRQGLDDANDYTSVEVSANGAVGPWAELTRHQGSGTDGSYQTTSHDISAYISSNTRIRFMTSTNMGNDDIVWFDNIEICRSP